jgi:hypothetical protein
MLALMIHVKKRIAEKIISNDMSILHILERLSFVNTPDVEIYAAGEITSRDMSDLSIFQGWVKNFPCEYPEREEEFPPNACRFFSSWPHG